MVTKDEFEAYERARFSGEVVMADSFAVRRITKLPVEIIDEISRNIKKYYDMYSGRIDYERILSRH